MWLYKQPSLTEGLDNLSSDEDEDDERETVPPAGCESGETDLTRHSNGEAVEDNENDHNDEVFTQDPEESLDNEQDIHVSETEGRSSSAEPPNWLVRAISICSEGEDLEVLASEADVEELSFPQAFSEYDVSKKEEDESSPFSCSDSFGDLSLQQNREDPFEASDESLSSAGYGHYENQSTEKVLEKTSQNFLKKTESAESSSLKDSSSVDTTEDKQSFTSSSDSGKGVTRQRTVSDLANIYIDPKESDYLYAAGHTIHKALDCEVNGKYGEAFSLYKTCVGLLLSGVQGTYVCDVVALGFP